MSELRARRAGGRPRRADARRSAATVLDAAVGLLGRRPEASMEEIAAVAGVARQTVYAHYPSREALFAAVVDRITAEVVEAFAAADLNNRTATAALRRWLEVSWQILERYPVLLTSGVAAVGAQDDHDRHAPIMQSLRQLIRRGQSAGEFDSRLSPAWLVAATIGLGHAAGQELSAGRMSSDQAFSAFRDSALRVCGVASASPSAAQIGRSGAKGKGGGKA